MIIKSQCLSLPPLPNRGRRSCACACDSEEEVQAMEAWPWEEPGLGDVRSATWAGCVWRGSQQTAGAFGNSLQKNQMVGCPDRCSGGCLLMVLGVPGWAGWRCHWRLQKCCALALVEARRNLGEGTARCSHCFQTGGGGRVQGGGGTSLPQHNAS